MTERYPSYFDLVQCGGNPTITDSGKIRAHRGRARHDAVEVGRVALRHQHGLAASRRAAREIRVSGRFAVVLRDDALGEFGHATHGGVREIEARLLVLAEARVEGALALLARV